jgi:hypothetical protein
MTNLIKIGIYNVDFIISGFRKVALIIPSSPARQILFSSGRLFVKLKVIENRKDMLYSGYRQVNECSNPGHSG